MITVAEVPELETNLADQCVAGLKALINLHYQERVRDPGTFSPAQLDELNNDQLLQYFPELVPYNVPAGLSPVIGCQPS